MSENKGLREMLSVSEKEVKYNEAKEQYTFGDATVQQGMDKWYLKIKNPAHPEIFKVNGWIEDKEDFFISILKISVPTTDTKKLLEQLKVLIRYVRGSGQPNPAQIRRNEI